MEVFRPSADKQEKVKNVFKQLLERVTMKKNIHKKNHSLPVSMVQHDKNTKNKSITAVSNLKQSPKLNNTFVSQGTPLKTTCFNHKKSPSNYRRHLPIKGSVSYRFSSENKEQNRLVDHKIRQYNQLLITKSYIFSEIQNRKTKVSKHNKTQMCNFQKYNKVPVRDYKKSRCVRKYLPFSNHQELIRHKTQCFDKSNGLMFEPWQTDNTGDMF